MAQKNEMNARMLSMDELENVNGGAKVLPMIGRVIKETFTHLPDVLKKIF
ncbi:MAG: hypothetical protein IIT76_16355 [Prevotella sp.]|jgi:hypothetical protein|nr:hypothetical protein [Prevotella sp.]